MYIFYMIISSKMYIRVCMHVYIMHLIIIYFINKVIKFPFPLYVNCSFRLLRIF